MKKKLAFDIGWAFFSLIISIVLLFVLRIVLARWLGPHDLGLYQMIYTINLLVGLFATLGIPSAAVKYVAELKDDELAVENIIRNGIFTSLLVGLITGIIIFFLSDILASFFRMPELGVLLKIMAFIFPFHAIFHTQLGILNGLRKMRLYTILFIAHYGSMILFILSFMVFGLGIEGVAYGLVFSMIFSCCFGFTFIKPHLYLRSQNLGKYTKQLLTFGITIFLAMVIDKIHYQTDVLMIGYFLNATDVGYYSIAVIISRVFWIIPQAVQTITYPATSEHWGKRNHRILEKMINKSMRYCASILLILSLIVLFYGREIIVLIFGPGYIPSITPLLILTVGLAISGVVVAVGGSLSGTGRPDLSLYVGIISLVINIILNIILIPRFGIIGAAIATTISLLVFSMLKIYITVKMLGIAIYYKSYPILLGFGVVSFLSFIFINKLLESILFGILGYLVSYLFGLIIIIITGIVLYKWLFSYEDKDLLKSIIRQIFHVH